LESAKYEKLPSIGFEGKWPNTAFSETVTFLKTIELYHSKLSRGKSDKLEKAHAFFVTD